MSATGVRAAAPSARGPLSVVVAEGFFSRLSFGMLSFTLPLYAHHLGISIAMIGVLLSSNMVVAMLLKPAMGAVIDRLGVRWAYYVACGLRTCVLIALVFAVTPWALFASRGLHGVSIALRDPASSSVLAALGGKKAVAQRFAWYQTAKTIAGSVGQFSAGVLISVLVGDYAAVLAIAAGLSLIPLVVVIVGLRGSLIAGLRVPQPEKKLPMPAELKAALVPYAGLGFLMTGTAYLMANLLPILAVEYMGLSAAAAGSLYLVTAAIALSGPLWGWIADRVSLRLVLGVRAFGNIVSSLVWVVFPSYPGLMVGKAVDDVGKAAFRPAWGALMAQVSAIDPVRRSRTLAWMGSAEDAGEVAGPVVAGLVWSTFGLPALLIGRAVLAAMTEIYAIWIGRRLRQTR